MTDLEVLAKLASEATPGPVFDFTCKPMGRGDPDHCSIHGDIPRTISILSHIETAHGISRAEYWARQEAEEARRSFANAAYIAAASPDVVLALVRVALAAKAFCGDDYTWDREANGDPGPALTVALRELR